MKQLSGNQVRKLFLEFFKSKEHMVEKGANLIPYKDPTLLWINSGVAALKKYFDGSEKPLSNRITNVQKCIRTNDIENVGKTARHQTLFEMLGNFSIGDYFKKEAIKFAWEFLTSEKWLGIDKEKLYISVYIDDSEAFDIWVNECGINPKKILKTADNFWEIGDGPCGPNSEIFYDRGLEYDPDNIGEKLLFDEIENERYIEVWNIVFSQFDAKDGVNRSEYKELPQRNIDTGMGFERLVSIIQNVETNFDTDLFMPIIKEISKYSKHAYADNKQAYRVIADHIRTVTFALSDGALFSNEGRGYVLRRVLRRAVRYGIKLDINESFMYKLVDTVVNVMFDFYPYLNDKKEIVKKLVKSEEEAFHTTLVSGEKLLMDELNEAKDKKLSGNIMFKLYDTYGFPKELTLEIAQEKGFDVDVEQFEIEMQKQKDRAREARSVENSMSSQSEDLMNFTLESNFIGYSQNENSAKIIGLFKDGKSCEELSGSGLVIVDNTCFYAESGGQVADVGTLGKDNFIYNVNDVQKAPNHQHLHFVKVDEGCLKINDEVQLKIDVNKRLNIKANHSSVHLLHSALRKILGEHIEQAGSYVTSDYARFDFTHFEKLTTDEILQIEKEVNMMIMNDNNVKTELMSIDKAKESGAIALFDEKYGDLVRVVTMGNVSKELCGGCHVSNTQEIGLFKIESEESIGSGIRRLTTKTKLSAYNDFVDLKKTLDTLASKMKVNSVGLVDEKLESLIDEVTVLKKELSLQKNKMMVLEADSIVSDAKEINGLNVLLVKLDNFDTSQVKDYADILRNKCRDSIVFISNVIDIDKLSFVCALSKKAIDKGFSAGEFIKIASKMSDGKGGGRSDIAQGGGKNVSAVDDIFAAIIEKVSL
ncbi:MAG: alanine--tRNA ligase [Anaerorhabdus sp.]